jgi:2-aminoadipate transaminase
MSHPSQPPSPPGFSALSAAAEPPVIADLMQRALANPHLLSLAAGFTDNALLPGPAIAESVAALSSQEEPPAFLQYGSNAGRPRLRELILRWVGSFPGERLERFDPASVLVTNGSQQALYLAAQTLCDPGDIVLVESPSYFVFLELLRGLGLRAVPLPVDPTGALQPEAIRARLAELSARGLRARVKACYLMGYHANPSARSLSLDEKNTLPALLREAGLVIPVIEDGAYRDLCFEAPHAVPSVLSLTAWEGFPRLYLGTFTKPLATGLKVGYGICDSPEWRARLLTAKGHQDFGTSHFNQAIVEHLLAHGRYQPHLDAIRPAYAAKARRLDSALRAGGLEDAGWRWSFPEGGLLLWLEGPPDLATGPDSAFCARCLEAGVLYVPGSLCFVDREPDHFVRLSFGAIAADRIDEAASRFCGVARSFG